MNDRNLVVVGGDKRTAYMVPCLERKGYSVFVYGTYELSEYGNCGKYVSSLAEAVEKADVIVGGIPLFKGNCIYSEKQLPDLNIETLIRLLRPGQKIFAGVIPRGFREKCQAKQVSCYDFMEDEPMAVFNAIATAEGAILEAVRNQETNIHGSQSLVLGYGRCGRVLCEKLKGLNASVTLCCRKEKDLAYGNACGLRTISLKDLPKVIHLYEYIYNTIPAIVLDGKLLSEVRKDAIVIDLASGKGGVDYETAQVENIRALHCLGLPGKYAAKISGESLADFVVKNAFASQQGISWDIRAAGRND